MITVLVIYHANCDDGFGAAYCAWRKFKDDPNVKLEFHPAEYNKAPPSVVGKYVYILDFSYPPEVVAKLANESISLLLRDHHKSALEAYGIEAEVQRKWSANVGANGEVNFDMDRSGAMLAWNYFFPGETPPMLIEHIQDNDLWKFKLVFTRSFIRALRSYPMSFEKWDEIANFDSDQLLELIKEGEAIERFFQQQCWFILKNTPPVKIFLDREVAGLGVNATKTFSSDLGNTLAKESGTYGLVWTANQERVYCSLRSTGNNYDVSKLAEYFGGGGHKNAAAFEMDLEDFVVGYW